MSYNTFGKMFRFTTWGESHGPAIGCIVDGCPPNVEIKESDIQKDLNRRKPGQSKYTTQRKEDDKVQILSGVFEGKSTGTPIALIIYNKDQNPEITKQLKINLDLDMQTILILKNMELEIIGAVVASLRGKQRQESLRVQLLKKFYQNFLVKNLILLAV